MKIFEESLKRGTFGKDDVFFADIGVYALFANTIRCLPELETDLLNHAPYRRLVATRLKLQYE